MLELLREMADAVENSLSQSDSDVWGVEVGMGADGTPTSRVDTIAEKALLSVLESHGNPLNVLSEEAGYLDFKREFTLVVDPLDGTYNAMNGIPFYSVSLAVAEKSMRDVQYALVRNLVSGDEYTAVRGEGAFLNGERIHVRDFEGRKPVSSIFLGVTASEMSFTLASVSRRIRSMGSAALEMCMLASGATDIYCYCSDAEGGGLRVVDIAAAYLIVVEAGGRVMSMDFSEMDMPLDVRARASVLAIGDERILKVME